MSDPPPVILLMGPTASGKTALSLFLADLMPLEIISVDSVLVYKQMNIGTSKPSRAILRQYPHHLIDICEPNEAYSAAQFRDDALAAMQDITDRGRIPLLVGGTMLYYRSLIQGLSILPSANATIRQDLEKFIHMKGLPALHQRLRKIDPQAAEKIHPNDPQRIQRAIEVFEISGKPISHWWNEEKNDKFPYAVSKLAVSTRERVVLHQRIEKRFQEMLDLGFVQEVKTLRERGDLDLTKSSMRAVGYRQIWQYLNGDYSIEDMQFKGVVATRQLAKRQLTWLRSEQNLSWFYSDCENYEQQVLKHLQQIPNLNC